MSQKCIVQLYYGSYEGKEIVYCDENDENDYIIARAWKQADCNFLSMASRSAKILTREDV